MFKENTLYFSQSICVSVGCLQLWQTATSTSPESVYCVVGVYFVERQNLKDAAEAVVGIPSQVNVEVNNLQCHTTSLMHPLCYRDLVL